MPIQRLMTRASAITGAGVLVAAAIVPMGGTTAFAASLDTRSYTSPGSYSWTVPDGVHTITVEVAGGAGGNEPFHDGFNWVGHHGGNGDVVAQTLTVTPGDTLGITVAAQGATTTSSGSGSGGAGGTGIYNGGTGATGSAGSHGGGGGGGASGLRINGNMVIVAGGGGGAGGSASCGGNPGGHARGNAWKEPKNCASNGGDPGLAGVTNGTGESGSDSGLFQGGGGGGGGGWYGGGAGDNSGDGGGGGGGGTSYCATSGCTFNAVNGPHRNGYVNLTALHVPVVSFDQAVYESYTGNTVEFTGTVSVSSSTAPTPEGTVTLVAEDGSTGHNFETVSLSANGSFTYTCTAPCGIDPNGVDTIRADYSSSDTDIWLDSNGIAGLNFIAAETQTNLNIDPGNAVMGQSRDFTATVGVLPPAGGAVTGDVEFYMSDWDGSEVTLLGAEALQANYQTTLTAGVPSAGSHRFWAEYTGVPGYNGSQSPKQTLRTLKAETVTTASTSPNPTVTGEAFSLDMEVAVLSSGTGIPTGEVEVSGPDLDEKVTLDNNGTATLPLDGRDAGELDITLNYLGDRNYHASQTDVVHKVNRAEVSLDLGIGSPVSEYGEPVTLTSDVSVVLPGAGVVEGGVEFGYINEEGDFVPLDEPVALDDGSAELMVSGLDAGEYHFQTRYAQTDNFLAAVSSLVPHEVVASEATVTVTPIPETSTYGTPESILVHAFGPEHANGTLPAGGDVQLIRVDEEGDEADFGEPASLDGDGEAYILFEWLEPGEYRIYGDYLGSNNFEPAKSELGEFAVIPAEPDVALTAGAEATTDVAHPFAIDVTPYAPPSDGGKKGDVDNEEFLLSMELDGRRALEFVPTGTVELFVDGTVIGEAELTESSNAAAPATAEVSHTFTKAGTYTITAAYSGDDYVYSGEGNTFEVTVTDTPAMNIDAKYGATGGLAQTGAGNLAGISFAGLLLAAGLLAIRRARDGHQQRKMH